MASFVFAAPFLLGLLMHASGQAAGLGISTSASASSGSSSRLSSISSSRSSWGTSSPVSFTHTRSTGNGHAVAFASGSSSGGNSSPTVAEARSTSDGPGSNSEAVSIAKDGANVKTESNAVSNGQPTTAKTVAVGEGEDVVIDKNNTVIGNEDHPVSVEYYVEKINAGAQPLALLAGSREAYQKKETRVFVHDFWAALNMGGDIARLYTILAEAFFEDIGCEEFKKLFEGQLSKFLAISELSVRLDVCFFPHCEDLESGKSCCDEVQKQSSHCACGATGCKWIKPSESEKRMSGHFFWKCDKCEGEAEACRCF